MGSLAVAASSLVLAVLLVLSLSSGRSDAITVDTIINNPRVLSAYLKCVLATGPCTKEGRQLKRLIPEVLKTACKSCSSLDKENLRKFLRRVQADPKLSKAWLEVLAKYDPNRHYRAGLLMFVNEG